eukprot:gene13424-15534_t
MTAPPARRSRRPTDLHPFARGRECGCRWNRAAPTQENSPKLFRAKNNQNRTQPGPDRQVSSNIRAAIASPTPANPSFRGRTASDDFFATWALTLRQGDTPPIRQITTLRPPKAAPAQGSRTMQTRNPFLDEFAKTMEGAMGLAQAASEEAKAALRAQADRWVAEMDLVRRDEFEAMRDHLTAEIAELKAALAKLTMTGDIARPTDDAG